MPPGPSGACAAPLRTGYSSSIFHLMRMGRGLQAHWSLLFWWSCDQSLLGCKAHVINLQSCFTSRFLWRWLLKGVEFPWWEEPSSQQWCVSSNVVLAEEQAGMLVFWKPHSSGKM